MFGAIAGGIASALAGGAMSKLFGGGQKAASGGIQGDVLATDNNTVGMGDAGIKSAIQGSNVPTLMRPSLVLFLVLWLKLVKDFLKVRCRLALLPFLISCLIWLDLVASLPLIKERILVIILLLHFLSLMLGSVLVLMLPLLVWLTPDLRIKKSLLKCNWTIRKRLRRCKMRLRKRLLRSEERFSRNAETDLVCRLLLEKKNKKSPVTNEGIYVGEGWFVQASSSGGNVRQDKLNSSS